MTTDIARGIPELLNEVRNNGYKNMSDNEIEKLMQYREEQVRISEEMTLLREKTAAEIEAAREYAEKMADLTFKEHMRLCGVDVGD